MTTKIAPPEISENIWGDEPELTYYTIRYYNPSGIGVEKEWTNVPATSKEDARDQAQGSYRIPQGMMYRLYAFKQNARV